MMDLEDLRLNVQKTKGALDYYSELLSLGTADKITKQRLTIVKNEIIKLTMKTEQIAKQIENQITK